MTFARYTKGQVILLTLVFAGIFMTVSTALVGYVTAYGRMERATVAVAQALAIAEGALDEANSQLNQDPSYDGEEDTPLGNGVFTVSVAGVDSHTKRMTATGYVPDSQNPTAVKKVEANVGLSNDVISFHYGIQAGNGGFTMDNSSSITGNVFSNGPVIGSSENDIRGDVVSAGPSGWVYGIHATGSVYAHTIGKEGENTTIDKDAYYTTIVDTTVSGTPYPDSPDQTSVPLPISDSQISEWEAFAESGGTITACDAQGNYVVSETMSLGPKKIACNLVVKNTSGILTITGPLWVTGNITTQTTPTIRIDPALGSENVAIIADNPSNRAGSGIVVIGQSTIFQGSGADDSFVFLISQNNSAETGGATVAIDMSQGASALVAYASHGLLTLSQSVGVKEATGYKIALSQSANVVYDTGLPNAMFKSGPGGSWGFIPGTYAITR
ncbi:hypothetical protein A3I46_02120 [Candidatus Kaiserbacteria bacterium RIFCSPLOWO2_02_FULL_54_13]|uniref:Uncharacterized protein n=1 Tax=Candidatus Kaiserbacteria bacterium RIFCSPHIGHO2_02_FULL_54_22 TaxID=1798495 RepID=A0A1F6DKS9_9BACT|nr:MAG: hypothetical protein A3C19_02875 [Candidatus Kaiserbacteria bacterium RIFCSPHIGHO2_02_FULL_54_22]OGG82922.1 MAG: hypothetical protein A3I46_02120 [Candidatus Kaiserbacteria bacterium RIFCSPLOWO2_02_FULL_54_13]